VRKITRLGLLLLVTLACSRGGGPPRPPTPVPAPPPTPPPVELRFVAVGDTGTAAPEQFQVGRAMAAKCRVERCDFALLLGDNFYPDGVTSADDPQWRTKFEEPYAELLSAGVSFYAVLGNHDYAETDFTRGVHQVARSQADPRFVMPATHYTFERAPVRFVALDTQKLVSLDDAYAEQETLLPSLAVASGPRPWVIAAGHHPYLSNGPNGNAPPRLARFLENVLCRRADLYLAGHDHNLQMLTTPGCGALLVVAGGGGYTTYALPGAQPALFQAQSLGFAYVVATPTRLRVELINASGQPLFAHEVSR
jgi:tartrate-resistant acid phosphatase type 5